MLHVFAFIDYADPFKCPLRQFFVQQTIALKVTDVQLNSLFMLNVFLVVLIAKPTNFVSLSLNYPFIQANDLFYHEFNDLVLI